MITTKEFLSHHGVKGMKWGVRKDRKSSSKGSQSSGTPKPKAHELSDEDLKKAIERMNLEQQYSNLISPKKPKDNSEAAAFVKDLGKNLVKTAVGAVGTHAINKALKK